MKKIVMVVLALSTLALPQMASAYSWPGNKWPAGNPTVVGVQIANSIPAAWAAPFGHAMAQWNQAGARFLFQASTQSGHVVALRHLWFESALAVTYIREGVGHRATYDRDIDFNSKYSWDVNGAAGKYDAWSTMTHELGHWLTLGDLYNGADYWKTMYGYSAPGNTYQRTLDADDAAGIRRIYGVR